MFEELKLKSHTSFYNSGTTIAKKIQEIYAEENMNRVALIIIDYKMPGMNGIELINWTRNFLSHKKVSEEDMPRFAFRAQQFWDLSPETIREIFDMGIKTEDIIEKVIDKKQIERYFRRISYFYR